MTLVSFPYRDMGKIRESHPWYSANKKEFINNQIWDGKRVVAAGMLFVLTLNRFFLWLQRDAEATGNLSFVRYCQS
ncbi:MAG TPA: hypothetical protein PKM71_04240, partial [Candidatus Cloacimonas sp.]|nr:hypothetical protein [Candidatus Cloacimonas sp.]